MTTALLIVALVIIVCILCNKITSKLGIPMLLAFILLGMVFGSDGIFKIPFEDFKFAEQVWLRRTDLYYLLRRLRHQVA